MKCCLICHRTDAFTPGKIRHDGDWHLIHDLYKDTEAKAIVRSEVFKDPFMLTKLREVKHPVFSTFKNI